MDTQHHSQIRVNRRAHGRGHSLSVAWALLGVAALCTACGDDGILMENPEGLTAALAASVRTPSDTVHANTLEDLKNFDRFCHPSMHDSLHDALHLRLLRLEASWDQYDGSVRGELVARRNILNLQQLQRIMDERD